MARKLRMTIDLNEPAAEALQELTTKTGRTTGQIFEEGLALMMLGDEFEDKGGSYVYVDNDNKIQGRLHIS
jgi:hypothetical protein